MKRTCRIILADDHAMFRQGLKRIIEEQEGPEVIGEASDGAELLATMKKMATDMVIIDISMPKIRGIEATKEIKMVHPEVKVLILTMHRNTEYFHHAISAGAEGFLLKEDADQELLTAIEKIQQGNIYVSPLLSHDLAEDLAKVYRGKQEMSSNEILTIREREVLKLIAEGKSNREIADLLFISVRTVEHHRSNMMKKLNIKNTADLVKYALRKGYTTLNP